MSKLKDVTVDSTRFPFWRGLDSVTVAETALAVYYTHSLLKRLCWGLSRTDEASFWSVSNTSLTFLFATPTLFSFIQQSRLWEYALKLGMCAWRHLTSCDKERLYHFSAISNPEHRTIRSSLVAMHRLQIFQSHNSLSIWTIELLTKRRGANWYPYKRAGTFQMP